MLKPTVVNDKPYKKNSRTAPQFLITDTKNFEVEKERLINYLKKAQSLGADNFEGKESHSFGTLTAHEWNNMFLQTFGPSFKSIWSLIKPHLIDL